MNYLADSNILTTLSQEYSPKFKPLRLFLTDLFRGGDFIYIVPQNLIEYWTVATRPAESNGLGLSVDEATIEIERYKKYFQLRRSFQDSYIIWESLVIKYRVMGKNTHDAHLVAAMIQNNITHILTFNGKDFKRFDEVIVVDPTGI